MKNAVSTKVVKLDLDFILDNFWKPVLWGKTWTIFEYNGYRVTIEIESIYPKYSRVWFYIRLYGQTGKELNTEMFGINFEKGNRNLTAIQNRIDGAVWNVFVAFEKDQIRMRSAYQETLELQRIAKDTYEEKANDFLDELGIENEEVREAYVIAQRGKVDYSDKLLKILDEYKYTIMHKELMGFALFADSERLLERTEDFGRLNGFKIGAIRKEIKKELESIEIGDFYETIELDELQTKEDM